MNTNIQAVSYDWLMAHASDPEDGLTMAFAGVIQSAGKGEIQPPNLGMGLSLNKFVELLDRFFPGASVEMCVASNTAENSECQPFREDEFQDLVELLLEHRSDDAEHTEWLAYAFASGCMGKDHLYADMGLPGRPAVSGLLERHFNSLFLKNEGRKMKWKKFLYKQLCDRAEVQACPAPSCSVCDEYRNCFGTEENAAAQLMAAGSPV
jgi:nitrogen fixation protein NifQ